MLVEDIERIEVIRGPASALYGADAFTGVINVITRTPGEGGSFAVARIGNKGQAQGAASFSGAQRQAQLPRRLSATRRPTTRCRWSATNRVDVERPNDERRRAAARQSRSTATSRYDYAEERRWPRWAATTRHGDFTLQGLSRLGQTVSDPPYEAQAYGALTTPVGIRLGTSYDHVDGHRAARVHRARRRSTLIALG